MSSAGTDIPCVNITVDPNEAKTGALEIIKHLRPEWLLDKVELRTFTEGITNFLCGVFLDGLPNDTVMVRIYGEKTDLIIDREVEMKNMRLLHAAGCGPPLYCTFNNGICYAYLPGVPLDEQMVRDNHISRLIAREMAKLHSIPLETVQSFMGTEKASAVNPQPCLWVKIQKYLDLVPQSFADPQKQQRYMKHIKPKAELQKELNEMRSCLEGLDSPVVFCHNDLLCKNIIYNKQYDTVSCIDYEYGALNYEAFDIGNHFCEYAGIDEVDYTRYPDKAYQLSWLKMYLEYCKQATGKPDTPITDTQLERLYVQVNKFSLMAHMFWGFWALIQSDVSAIDFDYLGYAITRLNEYFARKEKCLALKLPH
ncbi:ethanolamine kinase 1-like [Liolophura sinensis]|uniref:ethanolamine kinase 1-like n=1 Tax=Liolophura sinensis TaxID=3198878 RepID=UPI0031591C08